jgi:hypothetical protein
VSEDFLVEGAILVMKQFHVLMDTAELEISKIMAYVKAASAAASEDSKKRS